MNRVFNYTIMAVNLASLASPKPVILISPTTIVPNINLQDSTDRKTDPPCQRKRQSVLRKKKLLNLKRIIIGIEANKGLLANNPQVLEKCNQEIA